MVLDHQRNGTDELVTQIADEIHVTQQTQISHLQGMLQARLRGRGNTKRPGTIGPRPPCPRLPACQSLVSPTVSTTGRSM